MSIKRLTRRRFLKSSATAAAPLLAAPYFVPATVFAAEGRTPPSDRLVMATIGLGGMGQANASLFMNEPEVQMVAVCDLDDAHAAAGKKIVDDKYGHQDCRVEHDFRTLLQREDLDAVVVAVPDHWHALVAIAALDAGKDVYCEKPLANSIAEGRAIVRAVERNRRVLQTGSHERSGDALRHACELVRNGYLGKVTQVEINMPFGEAHHAEARGRKLVKPDQPIPPGFDYDFWLGHTPNIPYAAERCHFWWRFNLAYGGGEMTDRGAHVIDVAQLALGRDDSGPVQITARGNREPGCFYDAFWDYQFENVYADGVKLVGSCNSPRGLKLIGDQGWLFIPIHLLNTQEKVTAEPASLLDQQVGADQISLGRTPSHRRNFLDCVKSRQQPFAHAEIGHRTATICHLNNIAMRLNRPLKWDPATETFPGDDEANALIAPNMRAPWRLPA